MYMASSWYNTSVVSKEEIRSGVLQEIKDSGKIIVDAEAYKVLENERKMIESWSKRNENDSKSLQAFREGAISAQPQLKAFLSNTGNSIHQGN